MYKCDACHIVAVGFKFVWGVAMNVAFSLKEVALFNCEK
ncbi:hypothetical protein HCH_06480 [Hahella chejuensis KCTC 2396]|uniref:Uncharacterized protein n=1 Tax=Hahella chejuensis (strain KCTC 2396) TaxID=349521 RepID=Q2S8A3_HAHCH|nr:hypothetical protein HCH_06480 [Hahella chejuensis KCTC 2396]